ncbi:hypothetical protein CDAR_67031 [Caerostris darwini]|uniref:Uncharacterized protein n=1 Tax=Caerostris darwini TaxID=1538125 RepID=A0AAV4QVN8_9ARAC|nr:hypothetical protein CDAR_67031 [Caerostris darwini]
MHCQSAQYIKIAKFYRQISPDSQKCGNPGILISGLSEQAGIGSRKVEKRSCNPSIISTIIPKCCLLEQCYQMSRVPEKKVPTKKKDPYFSYGYGKLGRRLLQIFNLVYK